jgi:hypothetical protein
MSEFRIMGKSLSVHVVRQGVRIAEITAIKSFTFEPRQKIVTEGYLGEPTQRQDEIFDEIGGSFVVTPEGVDVLKLQEMISKRATRRVANDEVVNCTFRIQFPNASVARITVPDMKFDPIPLQFDGRDSYAQITFTWKAQGYILTTT